MLQRYFRILEIPPTTDQKVIKAAYRKLAKKFHPDISKEPNAKERFVEIALAYETIIDRLNRPTAEIWRHPPKKRRQKYRDRVRKKRTRRRSPRERAYQNAQNPYSKVEQENQEKFTLKPSSIALLMFFAVMLTYPLYAAQRDDEFLIGAGIMAGILIAFWVLYSANLYLRKRTNRFH